MKRLIYMMLVAAVCFCASGCAAMKVQNEYGELKLYSYLRDNLTLETSPKTAFVAVEAPQGITGLQEAIKNKLISKGMKIVTTQESADLIFAVALSDASKTSIHSQDLHKSGETKVNIWTPSNLIGKGISNLLVNNWITVDTLKINAHVTMIEKKQGSKEYLHKETILSIRAQKTNLNWEDCATEVNQRLSQEITKML